MFSPLAGHPLQIKSGKIMVKQKTVLCTMIFSESQGLVFSVCNSVYIGTPTEVTRYDITTAFSFQFRIVEEISRIQSGNM